MKKSILFFLIVLVWAPAYGFDWIELHNRAQSVSLNQAEELIQRNNVSIADLYVVGLLYLDEYENDKAQRIFNDILGKDPDCYQAQWGVAECLRRKREFAKSIALVDEIINQHPEFAPAYITKAYIRYIQRDFDQAVRLSLRVLKLGENKVDVTNHVRAHLMVAGAKGMIAHFGGPISKAINGPAVITHLRSALKLQPDSAAVLFGWGSFYFLAPGIIGGDINKAKDTLTRAIQKDPRFPDPYVRLAQVFKSQGNQEKYDELIAQALKLDPQNELALDIKSKTCLFICVANKSD